MLEPVSSSDVNASHVMANVELELDQLFCHFLDSNEEFFASAEVHSGGVFF